MKRVLERQRHLLAILAGVLRAVVIRHTLEVHTVFALHAHRKVSGTHVMARTQHPERGQSGIVGEGQ